MNYWLKQIRCAVLIIALLGLSISQALAEESNKSAFKVGRSSSSYQYGAFYAPPGTDYDLQTKLRFQQSDYEIGIESPKFELWVFYLGAGVNFHTLKQDQQIDCSASTNYEYCPSVSVPENTFLMMREIFGSIGYDFGLLKLETSLMYATIQGNYYLDNQRYAVEETFIQERSAAILETEIFSWLAVGGEGSFTSTLSGGTSNEDSGNQTYIEYSKYSVYVKLLF